VYEVAPVAALHVAVSDVAVGEEIDRLAGAAGTVVPEVRKDSVLAPVTPIQYVVPALRSLIVQLPAVVASTVVVQLLIGVPPAEAE
jgi:hypothetical protein